MLCIGGKHLSVRRRNFQYVPGIMHTTQMLTDLDH